jgi:hypothetical protein
MSAKPHAVGEDAAVVFFQLIDNGQYGVFLKAVKHIPNLAVLEAGGFIGQDILGYVLQELIENVVKGKEIEKIR